MIKNIACVVLAVLIGVTANGQAEIIDTIEVNTPPIRSSNFGGSNKVLVKSPSVASSLSKSSNTFLKNYGPGSLSTSSIRGGSSSHTLVLWNDLPIQNPFLGLLDLSLLDTWAVNEIRLQKGGNSAMWGSGAIGGTISMDQKNQEEGKYSIENEMEVGSFSRFHEKAKLSFKVGNLRSISSISFLNSKNDFPFDLSNGKQSKQSNAMQNQSNFNQDLYYNLSPKNEIALHYWRSRANRQNPPTSVQNRSEAYQIDKADRYSLRWKYFGKKHKLKANIGYFIEELDYFDPIIITTSQTDFNTLILDLNDDYTFSEKHVISFGLSQYSTKVSSPANYSSDVSESRTAGFVNYRNGFLQVSGRQEIVDSKLTPFIPSMSIETSIGKMLLLKGKVSRNFRLPTLNDRYWENVGNPDLLAESGWSEEVAFKFVKSNSAGSVTAFNRVINNWIQWTLQDGDNRFRPFNLNRVWSRGLEIEGHYTKGVFNFHAAYLWANSTNTERVLIPKINIGDQLFYTPKHSANAAIQLTHKRFNIEYRQQFTGKTLGINENLQSYTTGDFMLDYTYKKTTIRFCAYNMWDTQYRIIERRPMPGRNFEIILKLNFIKN